MTPLPPEKSHFSLLPLEATPTKLMDCSNPAHSLSSTDFSLTLPKYYLKGGITRNLRCGLQCMFSSNKLREYDYNSSSSTISTITPRYATISRPIIQFNAYPHPYTLDSVSESQIPPTPSQKASTLPSQALLVHHNQ